jgi:hypothetical protein
MMAGRFAFAALDLLAEDPAAGLPSVVQSRINALNIRYRHTSAGIEFPGSALFHLLANDGFTERGNSHTPVFELMLTVYRFPAGERYSNPYGLLQEAPSHDAVVEKDRRMFSLLFCERLDQLRDLNKLKWNYGLRNGTMGSLPPFDLWLDSLTGANNAGRADPQAVVLILQTLKHVSENSRHQVLREEAKQAYATANRILRLEGP